MDSLAQVVQYIYILEGFGHDGMGPGLFRPVACDVAIPFLTLVLERTALSTSCTALLIPQCDLAAF